MADAPKQAPAGSAAPAPKQKVEDILAAWAAELTPANAPDQKHKGPLAWVREVKVKQLADRLAKAGFK